MEAASDAINKLLYADPITIPSHDSQPSQSGQEEGLTNASNSTGQKDTEVTREVNPAVEHETVKNVHETKEQTAIDRERHQHHYHTTVQPLADRQVEETVHDQETAPTEHRRLNKDVDGEKVRGEVKAQEAGFTDTREEETTEKKSDEGTVVGESVHHHLHETVQPVIEKETIKPSVTHKTIPVHEVIEEGSKNHGVTTNKAIDVNEFQHRLDGERKTVEKVEGEGAINGSS